MASRTRIIINATTGDQWYPRGQARLRGSIPLSFTEAAFSRFEGMNLPPRLWPLEFPRDCPHTVKAVALKKILREAYDRQVFPLVLWIDASAWAIGDPTPAFRHIEKYGISTWRSGWKIGQTTNDRTLAHYRLSRGRALKMTEFASGYMGFDLRNDYVRHLLWEFISAAEIGLFHGDTRREQLSPLPGTGQLYGHRWDQSVWSCLVHKYEFHKTPEAPFPAYYRGEGKYPGGTIFLYRGM
jgi:hypothetical protein